MWRRQGYSKPGIGGVVSDLDADDLAADDVPPNGVTGFWYSVQWRGYLVCCIAKRFGLDLLLISFALATLMMMSRCT